MINKSLTLHTLSFSYDSMPRPVFDGLSLVFPPGWTALAGPNGSGKTTLISLISGSLTPASGSVSGNSGVVICAQDMDAIPQIFSDPSMMNDPACLALLARLGIDETFPWRWDTLSGGERRRCCIADALSRNPEVLILDEPANHVDAATVELLAAELERFSGIGILISHNLEFIDRLCGNTVILRVCERGTVARSWACSPCVAFREEERKKGFLNDQRAGVRERIKKLESRKDLAEREVARSKKRLSKCDIDPHDHSARAKVNLARVSGKDASAGGAASRLSGEIGRLAGELSRMEAPGMRKTGASLAGTRESRDRLYFRASGTMTLAGGTITLKHPDLAILCDDRIVMVGDNGCGKTSLLSSIVRDIDLASERVFFLEQELSASRRRDAIAGFQGLSSAEKGKVVSFIYRLGSEPDSVLSTECASPGETRKLLLALAMLRDVSVLALDEPTNHLDALSVRSLGESLASFAGAVILVTHDTSFASSLGAAFWEVERRGDEARLRVLHALPG